MENFTITLDEKERAYVKKQLGGYVRLLIQADMALTEPEKVAKLKKKIQSSTVEAVNEAHSVRPFSHSAHNTRSSKQIDPTNQCKKCGQMIVAGKCGCGKK